ncbi:DNA (cytosine-5)-methyltransferase 1 [Gemmobacter caeni]|uniref:DNA (cytosine-5-)-methyltransferase n=1 Tax=Gemmobacter caeni TaxID=589035 RepID=A0A2T6AZA4_9RHOB|nr:DNA cytosine methyltransferase [Gemmobacter caeni]PTX49126.1 DNA (cytosine-5)-methyltransferase 1 [Gemmobacter caeni]TWI93463.1 DNA (cytosine-5)-methyltransferase 1 [Gemmobacter caeni]
MRFGSVCSGIEAASIAWHELGWDAAWLAEVDVAASAVLAHRFGATAPRFPLEGTEKSLKRIRWGDRLVNWGDMTRLPDMVRSGAAEAPDILCGGTPCQGFSLAGLRGGLNDPRGQLTLSFVELANAIDDRRAVDGQHPCAIFWENVPGVRSDSGNAFGHFLAALVGVEDPIEPGPRPEPGRSSAHWTWKKETREHVAKWSRAGVVAGPRRTVGWRSSDAQYFGLAQRRERLFVVASAREGFDPQSVLLEFDSLRRDSAPSREPGRDVAGTLAAGTYVGGISGKCEAGLGYVQPAGDVGLVPQWWDGSPVSQTLDAVLHKGQTMPEKNRFPAVLQPVPVCIHGTQDPIVGVDLAHALGRNSGQENAVCVTGDITHALKVEGFDGSEDGTGRGHPIVPWSIMPMNSGKDFKARITDISQPLMAAGPVSGNQGGDLVQIGEMAVRRLMPVECERLMGFPDGHTLVPVGKGMAADGPRYKQLGNSWAVPCVTWIGRRLDMHLANLNGQIIDAVPLGETPTVAGGDALRIWMCVA